MSKHSIQNNPDIQNWMATNLWSTSTSTTTSINTWSAPQRVDVIEYIDRIEFIYKETSMMTLTIYPAPPPAERVFKIVYSCVDGVFHKSERIYGTIKPAQEEYYEFEE
jgi:hypothetical protein